MVLDVLALQYLYGPNQSANIGNTTYNLRLNQFYATIWDASGTDTLNLAGSVGWTVALPFFQLSKLVPTRSGFAVPTAEISLSTPQNLTWLMGNLENVTGSNASDNIRGNGLINFIRGNAGNDLLSGEANNDRLDGGRGKDTMTGGAGADDFDFNSVAEIGKGATRDVIKDFAHLVDDIDLSTIDANGGSAGNAAFKFLALKDAAFTGVAGQLRWLQDNRPGSANDKTIIEGDINGNRIADFQIQLTGLKTLTAGDFFL